jgi:hypothetical protein
MCLSRFRESEIKSNQFKYTVYGMKLELNGLLLYQRSVRPYIYNVILQFGGIEKLAKSRR